MKTRSAVLWILSAFAINGPGCASPGGEPGEESQFQACRTDGDCKDAGDDAACERGRCTTSRQGAGGAAASGGGGTPGDASVGGRTGCDDGTHTFCAEGRGGFAGAIYIPDCSTFMLAGLEAVDCPDADGDAAKAALVSWCQHVGNVQDGFPAQDVARCGAPLVTPYPWELIVNAVCAPTLPETLRACADSMRPCERLPLCVGDGVYGCAQIRQECPGLTAPACRSGFDSRTFAGRNEIRDCLTAAPSGEDCVATFYRCVWGL